MTLITRLIGGLGNQLFQYAFVRHLAHRTGQNFKLDCGSFIDYPERHYALYHFNIVENIADEAEIAACRRYRKRPRGITKLIRRIRPPTVQYVREPSLRFQPNFLDLHGSLYLDGYWQCEKYFLPIRHILLQEFTLRHSPSEAYQSSARPIITSNAVAVHIRRGDYVTNPAATHVHGLCSLDYYTRAMAHCTAQISNPVFFIFSDDIAWAHAHLSEIYPLVFVSHAALADYEELMLMSLCKHHIIANSTFSWWGAWLNPRPDKIVIAPQRWFNDPAHDGSTVVPETWLRM